MAKKKGISIPERVPVASQMYDIEIVEGLADAPTNCWGCCNEASRVIKLTAEFPDVATMLVSYLHECLHAISSEYRVKMDDDDVDRVAQGMTQAVIALVEAE